MIVDEKKLEKVIEEFKNEITGLLSEIQELNRENEENEIPKKVSRRIIVSRGGNGGSGGIGSGGSGGNGRIIVSRGGNGGSGTIIVSRGGSGGSGGSYSSKEREERNND
jgi:hypothetical protein